MHVFGDVRMHLHSDVCMYVCMYVGIHRSNTQSALKIQQMCFRLQLEVSRIW